MALSKRTCALRSVKIFRSISLSHAMLLIVAACFSAGCTTLYDPEASQENYSEIITQVQDQRSFGQTFESRRAGFNGIDLWLSIDPNNPDQESGNLFFDLYQSADDPVPLLTIPLSHDQIKTNFPVQVRFQPLIDSQNHSYLFALRTIKGSVRVHGKNEDVLPTGYGMINGVPSQVDAAFRLHYDYDWRGFLEDARSSLPQLWQLIVVLAFLLIPGWLVLDGLKFDQYFDANEKVALSVGISLSLIPVLLIWTTWMNLRWNQIGVQTAFLGITLLAGWKLINIFKMRAFYRPAQTEIGAFLLMLLVFSGALGLRLVMVRDLAASPWVDSVHHATIIKLISEQGIYPETYLPLVDVDNARYHAGFHSILATFLWLSGMDIRSGMLFFCQVLNGLSVFAVYLFTRQILRQRSAAIIAAGVTGFISPMPAYYTSWGRYTQLAGMLIFPAAMAMIFFALNPPTLKMLLNPTQRIKLMLGAAILSAGVVMHHYRVAAFLGCLLIVWVAWPRIRYVGKRLSWPHLRKQLGQLAWIGGLSALLISPWLPSTLTKMILPRISPVTTTPPRLFSDFTWGYLTSGYGYQTLVLAGAGILFGIIARKKFAFALPVWIASLFFLANLNALGLMGGSLINNTSVQIALFMPVSACGGYLLAQAIHHLARIFPSVWLNLYKLGVLILGASLAFSGAQKLTPILNPITFLFREADAPAIRWVEENTPADATILINPFSWGYGLYAGNDGGYWISPLAGRKTMPPPILYGFDNDKEDIRKIVETCKRVLDLKGDIPTLHAYLAEEDIDYIYLGRRGGALSAKAFKESGFFSVLYQENGVWIFKRR